MRDVIGEILTKIGYDVSFAVDGVDGVDGVDAYKKASSTNEHFDLFLVDFQIPNMDGITFTQKLTRMDKYRKAPGSYDQHSIRTIGIVRSKISRCLCVGIQTDRKRCLTSSA